MRPTTRSSAKGVGLFGESDLASSYAVYELLDRLGCRWFIPSAMGEVIPTLPMFLAFPLLLPRIGFWLTLLACVVVTLVCFGLFALLVRRFGIDLLP